LLLLPVLFRDRRRDVTATMGKKKFKANLKKKPKKLINKPWLMSWQEDLKPPIILVLG
jgi:hypothetical protein